MGARRCNVQGCKSLSGSQQHRGVTFHTVPLNPVIRSCWMANCQMPPNKVVTKSILICSRHFRRADFQTLKNNKYLLKSGAVPTMFPWGSLPYTEPAKQAPPPPNSAAAAAPVDYDMTSSASAGAFTAADDSSSTTVAAANSSSSSSSGATEHVMTGDAAAIEESLVKKILVDALKAEMKSPIKRSASADVNQSGGSGGGGAPKAKIMRKSLDSAFAKAKAAAAVAASSSSDSVAVFVPGAKIEAQDFNEVWHAANVVEVDHDEREVLIHFEMHAAKQ